MSDAHTPAETLREQVANLTRYEAEELELSSGYFIDARDVDALLPEITLCDGQPVLIAAIKALLAFDCVRYVDDRGPHGESYQSDALAHAFAVLDAAIAKAEGR